MIDVLAETTQELEAHLMCWWLYPVMREQHMLLSSTRALQQGLPRGLQWRGIASWIWASPMSTKSLCCTCLKCQCHSREAEDLGWAEGVLWQERGPI